jgi:hypothetical protein
LERPEFKKYKLGSLKQSTKNSEIDKTDYLINIDEISCYV